jgi:hypothetical protein
LLVSLLQPLSDHDLILVVNILYTKCELAQGPVLSQYVKYATDIDQIISTSNCCIELMTFCSLSVPDSGQAYRCLNVTDT